MTGQIANGRVIATGRVATRRMSIDFTRRATSYSGVSFAGTYPAYAQVSATEAAEVTSGPVWEDWGTGEGGGVWLHGSYTQQVPPTDLSTGAGWTLSGNVTATTNVATRPDGQAGAARVYDASTSATFTSYYAVRTNTQSYLSLWVRDDAAAPPASPGAAITNYLSLGRNLSAGTTWQRYRIQSGGNLVAVYPTNLRVAGTYDATATGAVFFAFPSSVAGYVCYPATPGANATGTGTVAARTATMSPYIFAQAMKAGDVAGDLDLEISFISQITTWQQRSGDYYLFSALTPDGLLALRYNATTASWILTVRGVDVLTTGTATSAGNNTAGQVHELGWYTLRVRYAPSDGTCFIRTCINGCYTRDTVGTATGSALAYPSAVWLGSLKGTSGFLADRLRFLRASVGGLYPEPEIVFIGDSTEGPCLNTTPVAGYVYDRDEMETRSGLLTIAQYGDTVQGQLTKLQASYAFGQSYVRAYVVRIGLNNLISGESAATLTGRIQTLIDAIRVAHPAAYILVGVMTPCAAATGINNDPTKLATLASVNDAIRGLGDTPITGHDDYVDNYFAVFGGGTDALVSPFDAGDHIHLSDPPDATYADGSAVVGGVIQSGRKWMARNAYRPKLEAAGILPA